MTKPFTPARSAHIVDVVRLRAAEQGDRPAYTFLLNGDAEARTLTYAALDTRARAIAATLRARWPAQERALMIYPSGLDFIEAFWGCLHARLIPVPAYPPRSRAHGVSRLQTIAHDCTPSVILSTRELLDQLGDTLGTICGGIPAMATDEVSNDAADRWAAVRIRADDVALLQYSSGSTASPKGVIVSHRNIRANQMMIKRACRHTEDSTFVGWLPFFHDMGLFGNIIQPLFIGSRSVLMSPAAFVQKPARWLNAISTYRGHTSGGPNFAYEHCLRRIADADKTGLDLSSWRIAFNGAEKPRSATMKRFAEAFAPYGFRDTAFYPCYGLAEAVLFVTGRDAAARTHVTEASPEPPGAGGVQPGGPFTTASSGRNWPPQRLRIVDPRTLAPSTDGHVGEIWVKGPHVAQGYWGQPELTQQTFGARTAGDGPFLRTGDLGFVRDGELFVSGRLKDLIIVRGQNYHPEDLEAVLEGGHEAIEPGCCAVFSVDRAAGFDGGTERLVAVIEIGRVRLDGPALQCLCDSAAGLVSLECGIVLDEILIVRRGALPRTSSGKIQRFQCRERFLARGFEPLKTASYDRQGASSETPAQIVRAQLRRSPGDARAVALRQHLSARIRTLLPSVPADASVLEASLVEHGLDSLRAMELGHWIARATGASLSVAELFEAANVESLAATIEARLSLDGVEAPHDGASPRERAGVSRLSYTQRALFVEQGRDPSSAASNISIALRLSGDVESDRLTRAWSGLLRRHPELAASFDKQEHGLVRLTAEPSPDVELIDARGLSDAELATSVGAKSNAPFTLNESVARCALFTRGPRESVLLIAVHHIVIDLESLGVAIDDFAALYAEDECAAGHLERTRPAATYADFVSWQERFVDSAAGHESLEFWRERLAAGHRSPRLPGSRHTPDPGTRRGGVHYFRFTADEAAAVTACAIQERTTPYAVLLTAYAILLGQVSRERDVTVGTSVGGRPDETFDGVVGCFANMVLLPVSIAPEHSFRDVLGATTHLLRRALTHQHYPLSLLIEQLGAELGLDRANVVRHAFTYARPARGDWTFGVLHHDPGVQVPFGPLLATGFPHERQMTPFEVTLLMLERGTGFDACFCYDERLVSADEIATLAMSYRALLHMLVRRRSEPMTRLAWAPTAGAAVRSAIARATPSASPSMVGRFEAHARMSPDAIALVHAGQQVSYGALNHRAEQLGMQLAARGIGPEKIVAVRCPRDVHMVLAILGIAKAGGAYLPVDVEAPVERLRFVMSDAGAALLATVSREATAAGDAPPTLLLLDDVQAGQTAPRLRTAARSASGDDLAYVMYTSGSTGTPKGVAVTRGNVARLFDCTERHYDFRTGDIWTLCHSIAFDFSVWEIWGALCHGARLVILDHDSTRDPERLHAHLIDEQVTVLNQTPSAFYNLLPVLPATPHLPLRYIVLGGEALKYDQIGAWFAHPSASATRLVNMYGITETTVHTTFLEVEPRHVREQGSAIGRGLDDLDLHLLNPGRHVVPPFALGEIGVSGPGLARGYQSRPALTASRFIPNPYGPPGARLYLTGDLAYRRAGHPELVYVGRMDRQVKLRGHRIELGEIEAALSSCPGVQWAVVLPGEDSGGHTELIAYVKGAATLTVAGVRDHLARLLPDFMVPARFVRVDTVPTNRSGKVDLAALRTCTAALAQGLTHVPPRTEHEKAMAAVWSDVLGAPHVGIDDNFYALGGDSIRALRVASRAKALGLPCELRQIFVAQTIRRLFDEAAASDDRAITWAEPFELVSADDRERLPPGLDDAFPVDSLLQGLVFHSQFSDDYLVYVTSFHVRAPWDADRLAHAIEAMAERHPFLRSSIDVDHYSEPLQLVHTRATPRLAVFDLRDREPEHQEREIRAWIEREKTNAFEWNRPPLVRWTAHRRTGDSFQLTLTEPYLDGWCVATLFAELFQTYFALLRSEPLPYPKPTNVSQRCFAQLERAASRDGQSRTFWATYLEDCAPLLVSSNSYAPASRDRLHDRFTVPIPEHVAAGLAAAATSASVPLRTIFLAAHVHMLSTLGGGDDVVCGVVLNGRPEERDGDEVIGSFLNTVPFRIAIDGRESWQQFARRVFAAENAIWPHRRVPFAAIRKMCDGALRFDTVFNYTDFHALDPLQRREDFRILDVSASEQTFFPLTIHVNKSLLTSGFELLVDFDCRKFSAPRVEALAESYLHAFRSIADGPSGIALRERMVDQGIAADHAGCAEDAAGFDQSVVTMIGRVAATTPDAVALAGPEGHVTYRQLVFSAERLAVRLIETFGVGCEDRVGIQGGSSTDTVVGILGVLKAGAAYVPVDDDCPPERLASIGADGRLRCVLTPRTSAWPHDMPTVSVAGVLGAAGAASRRFDAAVDDPDALAYVMYTSGSTGSPKGVCIPHRALAALAKAAIREYRIRPSDRVLQFSTIEFDISIEEMFMSLCTGATLVLKPADLLQSFDAFSAFLEREAITCLDLPTAFFHEWIRELSALTSRVPPGVRLVIIGGERMRCEAAAEWVRLAPRGASLVNTYGPTETTVTATAYWCDENGLARASALSHASPVGYAFGEAVISVLGPRLLPVAPGIHGEIHIGGAGVARGYSNQPGLTADRFIPAPDGSGARRYRTGDIGFRAADGTLHFVSRVDRQVKVRGYRVELEELEAALIACGGVTHAAAVVERHDDRPAVLRAYVRVASTLRHRAQREDDLLRQLERRLPRYLLPVRVCILDHWPTTVSGKTDYAALERSEPVAMHADRPKPPYHDAVVNTILRVYEETLRINGVGLHDSFFALGGDSLTAMRVVSKLRQGLSCDVSVRDVFEYPRAGPLADLLQRRRSAAPGRTIPPDVDDASANSPVLSFAQERLWMAEQLAPEATPYNIPAAITIKGRLNSLAFEQSLRELRRRHRILSTRVVFRGDRPMPLVDAAVALTVRRVELGAVGEALSAATLDSCRTDHVGARFDLERDPPIRVAIFSRREDEYDLSIALHHIAADGWSIDVLIGELLVLYAAFARGEPSPLPEPAIQYADYARRQRAELTPVRRQLVAHWLDTLTGMPEQVELPLDFERPAFNRFKGARHAFRLRPSLVEAVETLAHRHDATPYVILLAGFKALLHGHSGQTDIVVGTPVSTRDRPDTDDRIGLFTNQVIIRTVMPPTPTYRVLLEALRRAWLAALQHSQLPFEELVSEIRPRRDGTILPLVQTLFAYWPAPWHPPSLDGVALEFPDIHNGAAKYDLEVQVVHAGEQGMRGYFEYNIDLFRPETIATLAARYCEVLEGMTSNLDRPVQSWRRPSVALAADPSGTFDARV